MEMKKGNNACRGIGQVCLNAKGQQCEMGEHP